jgi:glycosyltransferase involved in cell wall biosynthesis
MYKIAICIPTYKRPLMLKRLLFSIIECNLNKSLLKDIDIIIVDNDADKTAEIAVNELKKRFYGSYKTHYINYPVKGFSNVRNELLKYAFLLNPDFLIFIDDDEYVTKEWLNELVKTIIINDADAARGPVLALLNETIPDYISCWFKRESYPDNFKLNTLTTGNLIIKLSSLKKYNVWFDDRFNIIGSEDSYFGIQIFKKNAKIFWAASATVYEPIPETRANIKWLLKRTYRNAGTYSYILRLENSYLKILRKIIVSLIYIISGIGAIIFLILPIRKRFWGILTLSEGIGGLMGLVINPIK